METVVLHHRPQQPAFQYDHQNYDGGACKLASNYDCVEFIALAQLHTTGGSIPTVST